MDIYSERYFANRSYYHAPRSTPNIYATLHEAFDLTAKRFPSKTAVVFYKTRQQRLCMTFTELQKQSISLATSLRRRGYARGDRVAMCAPNCIEFIPIALALARLGCNTFMFSNISSLRHDVLQYKCRAVLLFVENDAEREICKGIASEVPNQNNQLKEIVVFGPCCDVDSDAVISLEKLMADDEDDNTIDGEETHVDPGDPLCVFFTSGSTGKPKGVQLTHNLYTSWLLSDAHRYRGSDTVIFNDRPMTWLGGHGTIMVMAAFGGTAVIVESKLVVAEGEVDFVLEILKNEKVTHTVMMHYFIVDLLQRHESGSVQPLPSLRQILTGGQIMDRAQLKKLLGLFPNLKCIFIGYGSTDAGPIATQDVTWDACSDKMLVAEGIEVRVVDADSNRDVPPGTEGEICVRNPLISTCIYVDNEAASREAIDAAGWFHTGDIGTLTTDGQVSVSGRKDDMIKRATIKVFPVEVEATLAKHPAVKDVIVVGVPDVRLREELCACLIMETGQNTGGLEDWCKENFAEGRDGLSLAPKYFLQFEEFPLTNTGKTKRRELKDIAKEKLNLK